MVATAVCPQGKQKIDLSDTSSPGLILEIRPSGGKTFYFRYRDKHGRQRQHSIGSADCINLADARLAVRQLQTQIALGADPGKARAMARQVPTFTEFSSGRYMPYVKTYKRSWISDDSYLRNHLLPFFGKKFLDEITKQDVIAFQHGLRAKKLAPGTCNRCLILLRYAFNLALKWEIPGITKNPTKDVPLFEDPNKKERFLSATETHALVQAVRNSENKMLQFIIPMLLLTGARKQEVLGAKWEDFDLDRKQWRIPTTKAGKPRHVPLSDGVLQLLASIPRSDGPFVFANPKTQKPYVTIFCSWNTARKAAGLADVRIHDLRHSFASFLVNSGRTLYEVQKILGHTQVKTTQRYAHLSQETLIDAANSAMQAMGQAITFPALTHSPASLSHQMPVK